MTRLWSPAIKDDPEAFVLFAFPWGQDNTPLAKYGGPRMWQRQVLRDIKTIAATGWYGAPEHATAAKGVKMLNDIADAIAINIDGIDAKHRGFFQPACSFGKPQRASLRTLVDEQLCRVAATGQNQVAGDLCKE